MEETKVVHKKKVIAPNLRFKDFNEEWKNTKLSDIADFQKGKGISKTDIIEDGELECIRYGELYTTYNELIVNVVSKTNLPAKDLILSEYNDVIIPASGESQLDIATASCVLKAGVALSGDLNIIRSTINGIFLSFYLNNKRKHDIAKLAQGSSVVHLYSSQLQKLKLNIPSLPEQQKIASFLSALDEKMQLLNRKKQLLEQYKKGVMQQLFSGKLRFKDENGKAYPNWEEKKLGDVGKIRMCKRVFSNETSESGDIPFYKIGTFGKTADAFITKELYNNYKEKFSFPKVGDILMSASGTLGRTVVYDGSPAYFQDSNIVWIDNDEKLVTNSYLYFIYQIIRFDSEGGTIQRLYNSIICNAKFSKPCLEEQKKIADFLSAIDVKIESLSNQINQTQNFKKGLLQQMFV